MGWVSSRAPSHHSDETPQSRALPASVGSGGTRHTLKARAAPTGLALSSSALLEERALPLLSVLQVIRVISRSQVSLPHKELLSMRQRPGLPLLTLASVWPITAAE